MRSSRVCSWTSICVVVLRCMFCVVTDRGPVLIEAPSHTNLSWVNGSR